MMQERSLKDVELKADANGQQQHIYVRVANVLNAENVDEVEPTATPNSIINGIQFAICDKTNVNAPENKFYLNSYDLSIDNSALLPLVNNDANMLQLLPDDMVKALENVELENSIFNILSFFSFFFL